MLICSSRFSIYLGQPKATSLFNSQNLLTDTLCATSRLLLLKAASCHCQYTPWLPRSGGVSPSWGFCDGGLNPLDRSAKAMKQEAL